MSSSSQSPSSVSHRYPVRDKFVNLVEQGMDRELRHFVYPNEREAYAASGRDRLYASRRHHRGGGPFGSLLRVIQAGVGGGLTGAIVGAGVTTPLLMMKAVRGKFQTAWRVAATISGVIGGVSGAGLGVITQSVREMLGTGSHPSRNVY